jgi:ubiquinone/menaquinone biosynthesis C-methylase UbiE
MSLLEASGLGAWRKALVSGARGRTLDLGSGTGRNLDHLPEGVRVTGADPCFASLRKAAVRGHGAPLVLARAEALPFRAGAFDTVLSGLVFCSVGDPARGLSEVRRVLEPAGTLRMLEHVRHPGRLPGLLQDLSQPAWTWFTGGCHPNRETERSVRAAGFSIEEETLRRQGAMRLFTARRRPVRPGASR